MTDFVSLSSLCSIESGKRPNSLSGYSSIENDVPVYGASKIIGYCSNHLFDEQLLITGRVGTHGIIQRSSGKSWPSDNTLVVKTDYYGHIYEAMKHIDYQNLNCGSTQPLITQTALGNVKIPLTSNEKMKHINLFITKLMGVQDNLIKENEVLSSIRDELLPKLMSGEMDVSKIDLGG